MIEQPELKWEANPDVPQGTPGLTFQCGICFALVTDRAGHENFHAMSTISEMDPNLQSFTVEKKYGIEFEDESADDYEFNNLPDALEKFREFRVDHTKQMKKHGDSDYEGMRLMVKTVTTATTAWEPYAHPSHDYTDQIVVDLPAETNDEVK